MKLFNRRSRQPESVPNRVTAVDVPLAAPGVNVVPPTNGFHLNFALEAPAELTGQMTGNTSAVSRRDALAVPAVLKARNLIAGECATFPLKVYNARLEEDERNTVIRPHPQIAPVVMYAQTFEDLLFYSVSYWRITRWIGGFPVEAYHVNRQSCSEHLIYGTPSEVLSDDLLFSPDDPVFIDGMPVPAREVIRFISPNPPLLKHAARAIRACAQLEATAAMYANDPMPLGYFKDTDPTGSMLSEDEVQDIVDRWALARRIHAVGYVPNGLDLNLPQWNPEQLQLGAARQHAVLEVANATGLDAEDLGVSTTSRTYQNDVERRQARVTEVLMPYLQCVEQRLSMDDVIPRGLHARFDLGEFLRPDMPTRMKAYVDAKATGAMTEDEIRTAEHRTALTPAQKAANRPPAPAPTTPPMEVNANGNGRAVPV